MRAGSHPAPGLALAFLALVLLAPACGQPDPAVRAVEAAIERHGGAAFESMDVRFGFRDARFRVTQDGGIFRYERHRVDADGREWRETLSNEGASAEVDGRPVELTPEDRRRIASALNSVVYFTFLPFRLRDPAVRIRDLGEVEVMGEPYRKVEVTFRQEGGGPAWEDRFVHWIHRDDHTLDYFAYRYHTDGGGTRFRRAVNRREVGGLLLQDWENYTALEPVTDIADYDRVLENDQLRLVSSIRMERVVANGMAELAPDEGFEVRLGVDRAVYGPGDPVRAVLVVGNATGRPRSLTFDTTQRYDFLLLDEEGSEVHRWSADRSFAQVLGLKEFEPGERVEWTEDLHAPARPGRYLLRAEVTANVGRLSAGLPVEVR